MIIKCIPYTAKDHDDLDEFVIVVQSLLERIKFKNDQNEIHPYMHTFKDLLSKILDNIKVSGPERKITLVIENMYVDKYFRDSYYFTLSGKHFEINRDCVRVFIFEDDVSKHMRYNEKSTWELQKNFLGTISLSPIRGCNISRTLLSPRALLSSEEIKRSTIRVGEFDCLMFGRRLKVQAFPYMKQDTETITCAEISALLITDYFSNLYQEYRIAMPSQILKIAGSYTDQRVTPSIGLKYSQLSHVLKDLGFSPFIFNLNNTSKDDMHFVLHSYLDSNIPIAIHLSNPFDGNNIEHSVICFGFGGASKNDLQEYKVTLNYNETHNVYIFDSCQYYTKYYVMDDNETPYKCLEFRYSHNGSFFASKYTRVEYPVLVDVDAKSESGDGYRVSDMIMPLYMRMNMLAVDARDIFYIFLSGICGVTNYCKKFEILKNEIQTIENNNPGDLVITRIFLASSRSFKQKRTSMFGSNDKMREYAKIYASIPMPKFIWICELYCSHADFENGNAIGEIVLDATSIGTDMERSIILVHYPYLIAYRMPDEPYAPMMWWEKIFQGPNTKKWDYFHRFDFGHVFTI